MLTNYSPTAAKDNNWVHESIYDAITLIFSNINDGVAVPNWPDIIPEEHRDKLSSRTAICNLLSELVDIATPLTEEQRDNASRLIDNQNDISGLLSGTTPLYIIDEEIKPFIDCFKRIFLEGFRLLSETKARDAHYKSIYKDLKAKTCPFCGYEPFEAPGLTREDEDHYLLKNKYVTSASNLFNLVPMCVKCNQRYKLQQNMIFKDDIRRKALNPYGNIKADICLLNTDPDTLLDDKPDWNISITPDIEEIRTWYEVFSIEIRLKETVLSSNYELFRGEIGAYLGSLELNNDSSNAEILVGLRKYEALKKNYPEQGIGFLKDKVAKMLNYYFEAENPLVVALVRDGLPLVQEEQVV